MGPAIASGSLRSVVRMPEDRRIVTAGELDAMTPMPVGLVEALNMCAASGARAPTASALVCSAVRSAVRRAGPALDQLASSTAP